VKIKGTEQFNLPLQKSTKKVESKQISLSRIDLTEARGAIKDAMKEFRPQFPKTGKKPKGR
jgi:hypothetical protein